MDTNDLGRSGVAVGLSSDDGAASVSALRASIPNADNELIADALNSCSNLARLLIQIRATAFQASERDAPMRIKMIRAIERDAAEISTTATALMVVAGQYRRTRIGGQDAQGTPTRSAETTGSVGEADGGPVAKPCAQGDPA